ncbi:hypothetical protein EDD71_1145 [Fonticella tunisiensis]|uniref:Uncharacterized protein n=1 Tax=Fonticella tunisiensis TaxID=1096341 RepID=A0A4R7KDH7_9CLOT|nr:hypothetical protein EDD71_1145 [Fonticella tunisiensis]
MGGADFVIIVPLIPSKQNSFVITRYKAIFEAMVDLKKIF